MPTTARRPRQCAKARLAAAACQSFRDRHGDFLRSHLHCRRAFSIRFAFPNSSFPAASGAVLLCATVVFASVSHSASKKFDALCAQWDADGEDSLLANIALGEEKARDAVKLAGQRRSLRILPTKAKDGYSH